jgi:hypothetical protein
MESLQPYSYFSLILEAILILVNWQWFSSDLFGAFQKDRALLPKDNPSLMLGA